MEEGYLSQYFETIAVKRLSTVEVNKEKSNQHEFNGSQSLKNIFGMERLDNYPARFINFAGEKEEMFSETSYVTWYDAREAHPTRSEYRLYFKDNSIMEMAEAEDLLIVTKRAEGQIDIIVAEANSTFENQIRWLFGITEDTLSTNFTFKEIGEKSTELDFVSTSLLEELGITIIDSETEIIDDIILPYLDVGFPKTREFSQLARQSVKDVSLYEEPDATLINWMNREEKMFRRLEKHIVEKELQEVYEKSRSVDVDHFISFSLSVHNRRKSRVGYALENHLQALFSSHEIHYSYNKVTENKAKPDFLFPEIEKYHDMNFSSSLLTMLGVKTTCKDRWRQVLSEANRISSKHLLTLEAGISEDQTNEMYGSNLQLVLPESIHKTYSDKQQSQLMNINEFICYVRENQALM